MKFFLILLVLIGVAYAWFGTRDYAPSAGSMQGVINSFQQAIFDKNVAEMRRWCAPDLHPRCQEILDEIREGETRYKAALASVGSIGFDYPRGRKEVDGIISGTTHDGDGLFSINVRVSQSNDQWSITHMQ